MIPYPAQLDKLVVVTQFHAPSSHFCRMLLGILHLAFLGLVVQPLSLRVNVEYFLPRLIQSALYPTIVEGIKELDSPLTILEGMSLNELTQETVGSLLHGHPIKMHELMDNGVYVFTNP